MPNLSFMYNFAFKLSYMYIHSYRQTQQSKQFLCSLNPPPLKTSVVYMYMSMHTQKLTKALVGTIMTSL